MDGEQRFVDRRGWLRNRRAVVQDDDGLTVERWLGPPRRLAWCDLTEVCWVRSDTLLLGTVTGPIRLRGAAADLARLAEGVEAAMAARRFGDRGLTVSGQDVALWLDGYSDAAAAPYRPVPVGELGDDWRLVSLFASAIAAWTLVRWLLAGMSAEDWRVYVTAALVCVLLVPLVLRLVGLALGGDLPEHRCRVLAEPRGVLVQRIGAPDRRFRWSQVVGVKGRGEDYVIELDGEPDVLIPRLREFAPVVRAARNLADRRAGFRAQTGGVTDAALSPAETLPRLDQAERGLSPADERMKVDA